MGKTKTELLTQAVRHLDIKPFDYMSLNDGNTTYSDSPILTDTNCEVILSLKSPFMSEDSKKTITDSSRAA